jgi:hypothetical protein
MENFFDIATPEEVASILGDGPLSESELAVERRKMENDRDRHLEYLACLYAERGDFARADVHVEAMKDEMRKADTARLLTHFDNYPFPQAANLLV